MNSMDDIERSFPPLEKYSAPLSCAKTIANVIGVLATRPPRTTGHSVIHFQGRVAQMNTPNEFIELQALITERDGMIAENMHRKHCGNSIAYTEDSFQIIAEQMRALKTTRSAHVD